MCETLTIRRETKEIKTVKAAIDYACEQLEAIGSNLNQEASFLIELDLEHKPIYCNILSLGTSDSCFLDAAIIYRRALIHNASAIILLHSHPGGLSLYPSKTDIANTTKLIDAGFLVNVKLYDHIIVGTDYSNNAMAFSMREKGIVDIEKYTIDYVFNRDLDKVKFDSINNQGSGDYIDTIAKKQMKGRSQR